MYKLDRIDAEILKVLQINGRIPVTQLSAQLKIPHATARDRIRKMEEAGVIEGYTVLINPAEVGFLTSGFVQFTLDQQVDLNRTVEALMNIEEVTEIYVLTGDIDALVRIWARDIEHLRRILYEKFNVVPGMIRTSTTVILAKWVKPLLLPIEEQDPEN